MMFLGPVSLRERDARVGRLIREGSATDDELFCAQYGDWPPRGLEKDTPCEQKVTFKGYMSSRFNLASLMSLPFTQTGIDPQTPDRTIYINRLTLNPLAPLTSLLTSRMAIARAHTFIEPLVGIEWLRAAGVVLMAASLASSYRYAIGSSFAKLVAPSVADCVGEEHIRLKQIKDGESFVNRRAFLNDALNIVNSKGRWKRRANSMRRVADAVLTMMPREYFSQDHELQARLHCVLVRGYKGWGRLPANEDELFVALSDMGIRQPPVAKAYIADDGQAEARRRFDKLAQTGYVAAPAAEMNIGIGAFQSEEILHRFWAYYLPMLCGDLYEKYGDSKGLARMGYNDEPGLMGLPVRSSASPLDAPPAKVHRALNL